MKAWRAHAAVATQHSGLDLEIAGGGFNIQKQDGAIGVSATEILVLTHINLAPVYKTDRLSDIRFGNIKNQRLSVFELCLELGKTMLPLESGRLSQS
jgi:hypothetical protein